MDNTNFIGDLRKKNNSNTQQSGQSSQGRQTPLDAAAGFIGDLTINQQRNKEIAQYQNYLAQHGGQTPLGTLVRYVGDDPNVASSKWAKAAQDTYNYNKYGAGSGITFDNSTGKITVKATKAVKNSDWYKEMFKENSTFRQVAKMYGANPNADTSIKMQDKDGNVEEVKVKDWLQREADAFNDYVDDYAKVIMPTKASIEEASEGRITFSDNDAITSLHNTSSEKNKFDNDSVVNLPAVALRGFGFDKLPSFNEKNQTISAKDFYEWYQVRVGGDEHSGSTQGKIDEIENLQRALASSISRILNDKDVSETDKHNLAKALSLVRTLSNDKPETDGWVKTALFGKSMVDSAINTIVEADINLFSFFGYTTTKLTELTSVSSTSGKVLAVATLGGSLMANIGSSASLMSGEALKAGATDLGELIAGIDGSQDEASSVNALTALGEMSTALLEGNGKEVLTKWAERTNTPLNEEALAAVDDYYTEGQLSRENISGWAVGGRIVGNFVGEIVKQIALTNVVGGLVGSVVESAVSSVASSAATEALSSLSNSVLYLENGLELYVGAQRTSQLCLNFVKAVELTSKAFGYAGNIMAQAFVDTVLNDEETIERLLENPNDEERHAFYEAYNYNAKSNIFGEIMGLGFNATGRGLAFGLRKTGVSAWATRRVSWLGAKKHTALALFSDWMANGNSRAAKALDKIFKASDKTSKWWGDLHWTEAKALFEIADAGKGKSWSEATEATQKAVINRMEVELAMNNVTRGTMRMWKRIIGNDAIALQYKGVNDAYSDLLKSEGKNAREIGEVKSVSQETSDYIALLSRYDQVSAKQIQLEAEGKSLPKNEAAYKEDIKKRIDDYESAHSESHVNLAKNYLNKFRAYEYAYMNLAVKGLDAGGLGLYDEETVNGWRSTGFWGKNGEQYIPLIAIKDGDDAVSAASKHVDESANFGNYKAKLSVDEYELKPGDIDAHYLDPQMTIYAQQVTAAKVYNAREWGNVLIANDVKAHEIDVDGRPVTKSEIRSSRAQIRGIAEKTLAAYKKEGDILDFSIRNRYKAGTASNLKKAKAKFKESVGALNYNDIKALRKAGISIEHVPNPRTRVELDAFMDSLTPAEKKIVEECLNGNTLTIKNFNTARAHTDMAVRLEQSFIARNPSAIDSPEFTAYMDSIDKASAEAEKAIALLGSAKELGDAATQSALREIGIDDFTTIVDTVLNDLVSSSEKTLADNQFINQMLDRYTELGVSRDIAKRYLILQEYKNLFSGKGGDSKLGQIIEDNLNNLQVSGNLSRQTVLRVTDEFKKTFKSSLDSKWAKASQDLETAGGKELLDTESIYNYIYEQMSDFIDTTLKNPGVVQVLDANGKFHLYQLSPTSANLYLSRPDFSGGKKGLWGFFNKTNRLARLNNVGWSIKSFMNQWIKDPLDAFVLGGFTHSIRTNAEEIGELMGQDVVESVIREIGEAGWGRVVAEAEETAGRSLSVDELTALAREQLPTRGSVIEASKEAVGEEGAETQYYREMGGGYRDAMWGKFKEQQSVAERALAWMEKHSLGSRRETYLRRGVYANAYRDAVAMGRTAKEAATIAEFTSQNATTNFSRQFSFGNHFVSSIPFLGAALNGRASFWRLMEIDPVGISTRFITGLVMPTLGLITQSLQSESDKQLYKTFAEYEKESAICFVADGEKFKIPLPEELSRFISPFRHVVEKSNDANDHTWMELTANDLLQVSPVDLTGLVGLDENTLEGDPTFADRMSWEFASLVSQLSPTVLKTAYMAITGTDPYTGEAINKERVWIDEDGHETIIDTKSNALLSWLSAKLKDMGVEVSGSTMHALFKTLVGNAGTDIFDSLVGVFSGNYSDALDVIPEQLMAPFESKTSSDPGHYKFREAVKDLEVRKEKVKKEIKDVSQQISMLDPAEKDYDKKLANLNKKRHEKMQDYQQRVFNTVKNYQERYGNTYDRKMFASTINLLTFYDNYSSGLQLSDKLRNTESYYAARNEALRTMVAYGFDSPSDLSIFGYLRTNEYGDVEEKAYSPTAIMSMSNEVWGAQDIDQANIKVALEAANITRKDMFGTEYQKAKAAGKAALKKYKSDWNKKTVEVLAPYIEKRGVEWVLNNHETQELVDDYIFVDNPFKAKEYLTAIFGD